MKRILALLTFFIMTQAALSADGNLYGIKVMDIDGREKTLGDYKGKVLLIVNVASECGLTGQYAGLEALQQKYQSKGFMVLGFPCNDFGGQEPGSEKEIKQFCKSRYSVTFPMFSKVKVVGDGKHPLYEQLTGKSAKFPGEVGWNFGKFLIGKDGKVLQRFEPDTEPETEEVVKAVESALAAN